MMVDPSNSQLTTLLVSTTYRNKPLHILPQSVNIDKLLASEVEKEEEYLKILSIVRQILFDDDRWSNIQREDVNITDLLGGVTNQLLLIERKDGTSELDKLVFKLFGQATIDFIDRMTENLIFSRLSSMEFSPTFYGVFENGRIEGYLPGRTLTLDEVVIEPYLGYIATSLAQLHSFHFPTIDYLSSLPFNELKFVDFNHLLNHPIVENGRKHHHSYQWLWNKIELYFHIIHEIHFHTTEQQEKYRKLNFPTIEKEYLWYKDFTIRLLEHHLSWKEDPEKDCNISSDRMLGRLFAIQEVLCHNDLHSGNIILVNEEAHDNDKIIKLIDYEYVAYNYRGFDLANQFCEYCGFDFQVRTKFPNKEKRLEFLSIYLQSSNPSYVNNEQFLEGADDMVLYFALGVNLSWGSWGIVQAKASTIDFDYLHYAWLRYDAYFYLKDLYFHESHYL